MLGDPYCQAQDVIDCCNWPRFGQLPASAQARLLAAATTRVDRVTRRTYGYWAQSVIETISGRNGPALWLKCLPVSVVAAVTVNGQSLDNTYGTAWSVSARTGKLVRGSGLDDTRFVPWFPAGENNITVQYAGGYQTLPDDLVLGTAYLVRYLFDRGRTSGVWSEESIADWSGTLNPALASGTLPPHVMDQLSSYVIDDLF